MRPESSERRSPPSPRSRQGPRHRPPRPTPQSQRPDTRSTARRSTTGRGSTRTSCPGRGRFTSLSALPGPKRRRSSTRGSRSCIASTISRRSGRSARPRNSTRPAPWPTGAWPCPTWTIPGEPVGFSRKPAIASRRPLITKSSTSMPSKPFTRSQATTRTGARTCCSASRRSSRSIPTTSTPAPGWRL